MEKDCVNCLYMATHEKCGGSPFPSGHPDQHRPENWPEGAECLHRPADWKQYRDTGKFPPFRYLHHVESGPLEQMEGLHRLELSGARNILLGPGEAEVNIKDTPQQVSDNLHDVAEQCGYMCDRLKHDGDKTTLTIHKDWGPFRIEWEGGKLARIMRVRLKGTDEVGARVVWAVREAWQGEEVKA